MTGSAPKAILTLAPFRSLRTLGHQYGRGLQASYTDSIENFRPACTRSLSDTTPSIPFLPIREGFHPNRDRVRQKPAALPVTRSKEQGFTSLDFHYRLIA